MTLNKLSFTYGSLSTVFLLITLVVWIATLTVIAGGKFVKFIEPARPEDVIDLYSGSPHRLRQCLQNLKLIDFEMTENNSKLTTLHEEINKVMSLITVELSKSNGSLTNSSDLEIRTSILSTRYAAGLRRSRKRKKQPPSVSPMSKV